MIQGIKKIKKSIIAISTSLVLLTSVFTLGFTVTNAVGLSDIKGHWAEKEITSWITNGFVRGYLDETFRPDNYITRAEFAVLVNKSFDFNEVGGTFSDVKKTDWYYDEIRKAKKAGYMKGYQNGTVKPEDFIKRQEVAAVIVKLKLLEEDEANSETFEDTNEFSNWSKGIIGAVAKSKIMNGYPNGKFEAMKEITRAEAIVTLNNALKIYQNIESGEEKKEEIGIDDHLTIEDEAKKYLTSENIINTDSTIDEIDSSKEDEISIEDIEEQIVNVSNTKKIVVKTNPSDVSLEIKNDNESIVKAELEGNTISIKGIKSGDATITINAKKEGYKDTSSTFKVNVKYVYSGGGGGSNSTTITPATPTPTSTATPTTTPIEIEKEFAKISVDVVENMAGFKKVMVETSTQGEKFKVEGSEKVEEIGGTIVIYSTETSVEVAILADDETIIDTFQVDVTSDNSKEYEIKKSTKIKVDVLENLSNFKRITVETSSKGTKFKVEGNTLIKEFGQTIEISTSKTTLEVTILEEDGATVVETFIVDVSSDNSKEYLFKEDNNITPTPNATPTPEPTTTPTPEPTTTPTPEPTATPTPEPTATPTPESTSTPTPEPTPTATVDTASILVEVVEAMPSFKRISIISSTKGAKFKVEGSSSVKEFGEKISVTTASTSLLVTILEADGVTEIKGFLVDVGGDNEKGYQF